MRKFLVTLAFALVVASPAQAGKHIQWVSDVDWLRTNAATQTRSGSAYDSRRNIGQSTADTTQWFPIPGATWGPLIDLVATAVAVNAAITNIPLAAILTDTTGVAAWVHLTSDTLASALTACSLYVETAGPGVYKTLFSEADGSGKHRWFGGTINPTDNLPSYTFPITLTAAINVQSPWIKGHTQARIILVPVGNFRKAAVTFSYWKND